MANTDPPLWNGTPEEGQALTSALAMFCTCKYGMHGVRMAICAGHQSLLTDQRFLDGLVMGRRMAASLIEEEFAE